jgi:hypothetical protein
MKVLYDSGSFILEPETDVERGLLKSIRGDGNYLDGEIRLANADVYVAFTLRKRVKQAAA